MEWRSRSITTALISPACGTQRWQSQEVAAALIQGYNGSSVYWVREQILIGTQLGRYHVIEALGEGGMATVYKGYDNRLKREVAIKVILGRFEQKEIFAKRFEREAMAVARLTHPNIVQVIDYGDQDGAPYLVMEYIPGGTLKERIRGKPIPWDQAADMLAPVARALDYAHLENIIHRDIKPANLLITKTGDLMLSDFGIAKLLGDDQISNLTASGVGIGTPAYMAPEQGLGKTVDQRVDIYSLGVVLYEMITGRPPYEADTPIAVMLKHINAPLPRPKQFVPDIPEKVERVLFKALSKDPDHRFQTMREFADALDNLVRRSDQVIPSPIEDKTYAVPTPIATQPAGRPARKIWLAAGTVFVCAISAGVILLGGGYIIFGQPTKTQTETPEIETIIPTAVEKSPEPINPSPETLTPSPEITILPTLTPWPTITPDQLATEPAPITWRQGKLALVARNGEGNALYVLDLTVGDDPVLIYNPGGGIKLMAPAWSPDSSLIAFDQYLGNLQIISSTGSGHTSLNACRGPSWSSDGAQILCYASGSDTFDIVDAGTGGVLRRIDAPAGGIYPVWSPLGDLIVYPAFDGDLTRVWRMSLDGSLPTLLASDSSENYAPSWSPDGLWIAYQSNLNSQMSDIWIMDRDGENIQRITDTSGSHWSRAPSWSPDGKWLAFVSDQAGSFGADYGEIFLVSMETRAVIQVTNTGGLVYDWRVSWGK